MTRTKGWITAIVKQKLCNKTMQFPMEFSSAAAAAAAAAR
jgi:hypothetical protein